MKSFDLELKQRQISNLKIEIYPMVIPVRRGKQQHGWPSEVCGNLPAGNPRSG